MDAFKHLSLANFFFDSSKMHKHVCFCMKRQEKTTGLFTKSVFGLFCWSIFLVLGFFNILIYLYSLCEGFSLSFVQKNPQLGY